jgi:hypothetical protein
MVLHSKGYDVMMLQSSGYDNTHLELRLEAVPGRISTPML